MRLVNLDEIYNLALNAKEEIWRKAESCGRAPIIVEHWSASRYDQKFEDYHINIDGEGHCWVSTDDLSERLAHTFMRNTGAIGITLACAYNATTDDLGEYAPTSAQIEMMAQVIAVLAKELDIPVDKYHVLTHSEAADDYDEAGIHEKYGYFNGCERWDLLYLGTEESPHAPESYEESINGGNVLRGKALYYQNRWEKDEV